MGNQKLKWTSDEEKALLAGIDKHGHGRWKNILKDPEFSLLLVHRSNIDLKDKWRNLNVSAFSGSRERSRAPRLKNGHGNGENPAPNALASSEAAVDEDLPNAPQDGNNAQWYNAVIMEALTAMRNANGSEMAAICNFVEQRQSQPLPSNFRRVLGSRLRRLASQGKLEKVQNGYKIVAGTKMPLGSTMAMRTPKQEDVKPQLQPKIPVSTVQEVAAKNTASLIADAEYKAFLASEAMKEAEMVSMFAEESESMLELVKDIYVQCSNDDGLVFLDLSSL